MNQQINLYQAQFREDKQRFSAKTLLQSTAAVVATLLAIAGFNGWQILLLQRQVVSLEHQEAPISFFLLLLYPCCVVS